MNATQKLTEMVQLQICAVIKSKSGPILMGAPFFFFLDSHYKYIHACCLSKCPQFISAYL